MFKIDRFYCNWKLFYEILQSIFRKQLDLGKRNLSDMFPRFPLGYGLDDKNRKILQLCSMSRIKYSFNLNKSEFIFFHT